MQGYNVDLFFKRLDRIADSLESIESSLRKIAYRKTLNEKLSGECDEDFEKLIEEARNEELERIKRTHPDIYNFWKGLE